MQFRWVAALALWTFFIGPILGPPPTGAPPLQAKRHVVQKLQP